MNSYQLKQEDDNYILTITVLEESVKISCENSSGQINSKIFALSDLKTKDEIFQSIQNAFDVIDIFDFIIKNEKVKVFEDQSGVMQFLLYLASEDRTIELTLEKEMGENAQEEQGFNNEMEANENNMEQNMELNGENNVDFYQNENVNVGTGLSVDTGAIQSVESNYEDFNADNVESIMESNVNANKEQFNMEEFLKNTQPEINANEETNFQMDNNMIENNNNYNYVQNENENINVNNEFSNISVANTENITNTANTETTSNDFDANFNINNKIYYSFGQASENVANTANIENVNINTNANTKSYNNFTTTQTQTQTQTTQTNVNTNIFSQPKQEKHNMYNIPYITPADEQPKPQPQPQINQTQKVQIPEYSEFSSSMSKISTAKVIPTVTKITQTTITEKSLPKPKLEKYHEVSLSLPKDKKNDQDEQRISKLQGEQSSLKSQHSVFNNKITELTNMIKTYRSKITVLQSQKTASEIEFLRAENQRIKQQLGEIGRLRKEVAEAQYLRNKLGEYEILRQKAAQVDSMKSQLSEINNLKMKITELSGMGNRMDEIRRLKEELNRLNSYSANLNEINNLKAQIMHLENLRHQQQQQKVQSQSQTLVQKTETKMTKSVIKGDIIHNVNELEMLTRKINKSNNKIILNLLYKATADSDNASAFHQKCDKAESTLVLVESDKGKRFGGYTSKNWRGDCEEKKDSDAFVFSLDTMKIYDIIEGEDAIGCYPQCGPVFMGCQIRIFDNAFKKGGTTFERNVNYETEEDFELSGGERAFGVKEIEVYEVIVE